MTIAYAIGVDQSANHTGIAVLDIEGAVLCSALLEPKMVGLSRLVYIRDGLHEVLSGHKTAQIGVWESYSMGSTNRPFLLGEVGGIVQLALYDICHSRVEMSSPSALKKFITGDATASKRKMVTTIENRWGEVFENHDDNRADAYGLAQLGRHLLDHTLTTRRDQREVIHNILNPKPKKKRSFRANKGLL